MTTRKPLLAFIALLFTCGAQAQIVGSSATGIDADILSLSKHSGPPEELKKTYAALDSDLKLSGVSDVNYFYSKHYLKPDLMGVFVRVESALTCSASGQCQTDVFALSPGNPNLIFSAVAENIALESDNVVSSEKEEFPKILTNIPPSSLVGNSSHIVSTEGATVWFWDGKRYRNLSKANQK